MHPGSHSDQERTFDNRDCAQGRAHQVMDGYGCGGGWQRRHTPHEPGNETAKEQPSGFAYIAAYESIYIRHFIVGGNIWVLVCVFSRILSNYADDICNAPVALMWSAFTLMMDPLNLPVNMKMTRCLRCPDEPLEFLGYRIGWNG